MLKSFFNNLLINWKPGLAIAVVSVPLSISFAIASGGTPIMGLITSAWAGITAALFGGSNFNVISPAGAFAGILSVVALNFGVGAIPIVTIIAGLIMFICYLVNAQRFLTFIPGGAIFGFTLGISAIIAGTQLNSAFGLSGLTVHESILMNIVESIKNLPNLDIVTTLIFFGFLASLFVVKKYYKKVPSIIIVTPVGILLGWLATKNILPISVLTLEGQYGTLGSQLLNPPSLFFDAKLIVPAITIAVVGILETMLSAKIADGLTDTKHSKKREMLGLSLANIVSGLVGGMPATGVLGPTVLNIQSGAQNRYAAALKAIFVAIITLLFFGLFKFIPMPAIAAILCFVAISMVESKTFLLYYTHEKSSLVIAALVAALTIYKDPALGILVGSALGLLIFAEKVSRGQYEATYNSKDHTKKDQIANEKTFASSPTYDTLVYSIKGILSHLSQESHIERLSDIQNNITHVVVRLREVAFLDIEGTQALDAIISSLQKKNINIYLSGLNADTKNTIATHSKTYTDLKKTNKIFTKTRFALEDIGVPLQKD